MSFHLNTMGEEEVKAYPTLMLFSFCIIAPPWVQGKDLFPQESAMGTPVPGASPAPCRMQMSVQKCSTRAVSV